MCRVRRDADLVRPGRSHAGDPTNLPLLLVCGDIPNAAVNFGVENMLSTVLTSLLLMRMNGKSGWAVVTITMHIFGRSTRGKTSVKWKERNKSV